MAEIRDEYGNPIQLTDEHGNPVQLTDEHGNPMHLKGVATTTVVSEKHVVAPDTGTTRVTGPTTAVGVGAEKHEQQKQQEEGVTRSSSSSSSSSGEEVQGEEEYGQVEGSAAVRRRKKKGLTEKIKEKLTGGKHKDEDIQTVSYSSTTTINTSIDAPPPPEHEKKTIMEKIKEKLPGHHNH